MFLRRLRERGDEENKRIIDSLLPQRSGKAGMRILSNIMPQDGILPGKKKLDSTPKSTGVAESDGSGFDDQESKYIHFLEKALENAPCPGCKKLVESALVGGKVYQRMIVTGKSANQIKQEEIDEIRQGVKEKYGL